MLRDGRLVVHHWNVELLVAEWWRVKRLQEERNRINFKTRLDDKRCSCFDDLRSTIELSTWATKPHTKDHKTLIQLIYHNCQPHTEIAQHQSFSLLLHVPLVCVIASKVSRLMFDVCFCSDIQELDIVMDAHKNRSANEKQTILTRLGARPLTNSNQLL